MHGPADALALGISLALLGFWAWCLVDFARTDQSDVRTLPWVAWVFLLVLGNVVGGLLWLLYGRPPTRR